MRIYNLLARNLRYYWRTNLAVLLGVATATGVLGGAFLVGESVRASLREIALSRLGNVDSLVSRPGFLREALAASFPAAAPAIVLEATVARESGVRRASAVPVYGIDQRFWRLQRLSGAPPSGREAILTPALARNLDVRPGDVLLVRVPKPSPIPLESLHGNKDQGGTTLRLEVAGISGFEFSLEPRQGELAALYVPLARLQHDLDQPGKVNTILLGRAAEGAPAADPARILRERCSLADVGLSLRPLASPAALALESDSVVISDSLEQAANRAAQLLGLHVEPVLTYLVNSIALDCAAKAPACPTIPYSLVTALDSALAPASDDGIVLNQWAAESLHAKAGATVVLDYFVWQPEGRLATSSARFQVERIVPLAGAAADPDLAPTYPGITTSESLNDWDPPFPMDLTRIRPADERYWERYRATPKAFVRLGRGRRLWGTRFGSLSSIRVTPPPAADFATRLRATLDPAAVGLTSVPLRSPALEAARGATDFAEYFLYFSFFLILSALLLTGLFFKLGIEQRGREIGLLRSVGFSDARLLRLFLLEGGVLAASGAAIGTALALGYGHLVLLGLRTWWIGAVGTEQISLHASAQALALGAAGGVLAALLTVALTLRSLSRSSPRALLAGQWRQRRTRWRPIAALASAAAAALVAGASAAGRLDQTAGFFGAGCLLLVASLLSISAWLAARRSMAVSGKVTLGLRSLAHRPGRGILCITLIATATFTIVSLEAFRREGSSEGTGGYALLATSDLPLVYDPNTAPGREALNLSVSAAGVEFVSWRLRPGDDASCLNLYRPLNPRIIAPPASFLHQARFAFQGAVSATANPWLLLDSQPANGAIPAIADANSMTYSMHLKLGDEFTVNGVRYRMVAALRDSLFQGELLISEANFLRLFPAVQGYQFFLLKVPPEHADEIARELADALSDYGFHPRPAAAVLAGFHRVENTYLSTFRALGGLGLILGTVGLAAILLRNTLERRAELALLRAVGYRSADLTTIILVENVSLLVVGLASGTLCALLAVLPAASARGGHAPLVSLGLLLAGVLASGVAASLLAAMAALRTPLLSALKAE